MAAIYLEEIYENDELLEVGRKAIEDELIELRDNRMCTMRNNGLVIKERDGTPSHIIRMGSENALRIGLKAIQKHMENV